MADKRLFLIKLGLLPLLSLAMALALTACDGLKPAAYKAIDISGAEYAQDLNLPDTDGRVRHIADFKGKVTVVFFGFTQCPDVCPTTMLELAAVKKAMGADGDRVQGVFVSVDPERDTPEVLKTYVANFSPDFVALRGSLDDAVGFGKLMGDRRLQQDMQARFDRHQANLAVGAVRDGDDADGGRSLVDQLVQVGVAGHAQAFSGRDVCAPQIVWGDNDRILHSSGAELLGNVIANAETIVTENMGHCPMLERHAETAAHYLKFQAVG